MKKKDNCCNKTYNPNPTVVEMFICFFVAGMFNFANCEIYRSYFLTYGSIYIAVMQALYKFQ